MPTVRLFGRGAPSAFPPFFSKINVAVLTALRKPEHEALLATLSRAPSDCLSLRSISRTQASGDDLDTITRFRLEFTGNLVQPIKGRVPTPHIGDNELCVGVFCIDAIGSTLAALKTQSVITNFDPDYVVFCGIGGAAYPPAFQIGDVAFARDVHSLLQRSKIPPVFQTTRKHDVASAWTNRASNFGGAYAGVARTAAAAGYCSDHSFVVGSFASLDAPCYDVPTRDHLATTRIGVIDQDSGGIVEGVLSVTQSRAQAAARLAQLQNRKIDPWQPPQTWFLRGVSDYCDATASETVRLKAARHAAFALLRFIAEHRSEIKNRAD